MTSSQAARLAELLDFLHRHLTGATENIQANDDGSRVNLSFADWQRILAVQMLLARYVRAVAEPGRPARTEPLPTPTWSAAPAGSPAPRSAGPPAASPGHLPASPPVTPGGASGPSCDARWRPRGGPRRRAR